MTGDWTSEIAEQRGIVGQTFRFAGRIAVIAAAFFSFFVSIAAQSPSGLVVGHVVDGTSGAPIDSVMVTLSGGPTTPSRDGRPSQAPPRRVMSDDSGGFVFNDLAAGSYNVIVTKSGFAEGAYGRSRPEGAPMPLAIAGGQRMADLRIRIWKYGAIAGTVTDEANEPVVGAQVRVLARRFMAGRPRFLSGSVLTTDDRGVYRAGSLLPGDYVAFVPSTQTTIPAVVAEEYWRSPQAPELRSAVMGVAPTMVLPSGATANFGATPAGSPEAQRVGQSILQGTPRSVTNPPVGDDGTVAVYPAAFSGDASTIAEASVITLGSGEIRSGVDLHLHPEKSVRVSGTLSGSAVALQALRLVPVSATDQVGSESGFETAATLTDRAGAFTFLGVTPGQYMLRALKAPQPLSRAPRAPATAPPPVDSTLWIAEPISVGNRDVTLALTWHEGLNISGRFVFDGTAQQPTPEFAGPLVVESADGRPIPGTQPGRRLDYLEGDRFATYGLTAGRYFLHMPGSAPGWMLRSVMLDGKDISDVAFDLKSNVTDVVVTMTDKVTQLSGTVRSTAGAPDQDVTVLLFTIDRAGWSDFGTNPGRLRIGSPDAAGRYRISGMPAGDYFVVAVPNAETGAWREPKRLEALSRVAQRLHVKEGDTLSQDLQTRSVR